MPEFKALLNEVYEVPSNTSPKPGKQGKRYEPTKKPGQQQIAGHPAAAGSAKPRQTNDKVSRIVAVIYATSEGKQQNQGTGSTRFSTPITPIPTAAGRLSESKPRAMLAPLKPIQHIGGPELSIGVSNYAEAKILFKLALWGTIQ
ncbi:hypothetical protein BJ742DRAFT_734780 [Cladochytrium replicatum]|nr:hypothetical protein BJ742DRAFT_734780 [Cladochytrium replicatum]